MKKIEAIIRTMKFEEVKVALEKAGFESMTVRDGENRKESPSNGEVPSTSST